MPDADCRPDPFALEIPLQSRLTRAAFRAARPALSRAIGLEELARLYASIRGAQGKAFVRDAIQALDVRIAIRRASPDGIPRDGSLIIAANHPTGALDGLVLAATALQVRPDVRIIANHLLSRIPELAEICFFVDPFGGPAASARSQPGLRAAHLWLRRGGAVVMFPSGSVDVPGEADAWHPTLGRLAIATGARVLPCAIDARNSELFYGAGRVHPALRTLLLGRELLNKRGRRIAVRIGAPLERRGEEEAVALTGRSRAAVGALAHTPDNLAAEIDALPPTALLTQGGGLEVYSAAPASIPSVLQELGRLREITFRAVGEGTGRHTDLDRFDEHYQHLFVWNRERREIVGAYRVGATDIIAPQAGTTGLYTRTLFRFDRRLLDRMGPGLELGRSFVRAEYQRSYGALLMLWRGIGRLLADNPRYRVLFGAVSISNRYQDASQQLLRAFLERHYAEPGMGDLVDPLNPPPPLAATKPGVVLPATVGDLEKALVRLEGTQGMPVLLRHYLRLNATVLGFNIDPAFANALDALMMVRVDAVPPSLRTRCLGLEPARPLAA